MKIGSLEIRPETKQHAYLEMPDYAESLKVRIPMLAACGHGEEPLITITAAQHGRELQGIEVIRRVFEALDPTKMRGSVVALPVVNPMAVRMWQQDYPSELIRDTSSDVTRKAYNLNRHWPGKPDGALQDEICHMIWREVVQHSSLHIDLHGWTGNSLGMAWASLKNRDLLDAFSFPVNMACLPGEMRNDGLLHEACERNGINWLLAELPFQNRLSEESIMTGVRGVTNVLKHMNVIDGPMDLSRQRHYIIQDSKEHIFTAEYAGLVSFCVPLGTMLAENQCFGAIYSLETLEPLQKLVATEPGLLFNVGSEQSSVAAPGMIVALVKEIAEIVSS